MAADLERRYGATDDALGMYVRVFRRSHWSQWGGGTPLLHNVLRSVGKLLVDTLPENAAILLGAGTSAASGLAEELARATDTLDATLGHQLVAELGTRRSRMDPDEAVAFAQDALNLALA